MEDAAGSDGKFNLDELSNMLTNNRAYLPELVLPELLAQCDAQGDTPVTISAGLSVDIRPACSALANWNGAQNNDSIGGALIREFAHEFDQSTMFTVPFDPANAATTPNTLATDGSVLVALAKASANLGQAGFAPDEVLADTPRPIGRGFLIAQERFCFIVRCSGNRLGYRIKVPQWELLRWRINPCSPSLTQTPQT